ncbi:hypothetical protein SDC9_195310 [bioreactor metagenome]|uniref:Uncharacterized protein n=1 Tax=bioreactor metagenome TaxID=1076179 RepID=A0A645I9Y2_9ZZZZ
MRIDQDAPLVVEGVAALRHAVERDGEQRVLDFTHIDLLRHRAAPTTDGDARLVLQGFARIAGGAAGQRVGRDDRRRVAIGLLADQHRRQGALADIGPGAGRGVGQTEGDDQGFQIYRFVFQIHAITPKLHRH